VDFKVFLRVENLVKFGVCLSCVSMSQTNSDLFSFENSDQLGNRPITYWYQLKQWLVA